jgi:hypothetical protein
MVRRSFAVGFSCLATCAIADEQFPAAQVAECASSVHAASVIRRRIDISRDVLSIEEAHCAFAEFTSGGLDRSCASVKGIAIADPAKRHAWSDLQQSWDALDRTRLRLRQIENRLGIDCDYAK